MKHNREFEIAWQGLKLGVHEYRFSLDDDFMKERQAPAEMHDWNAEVTVKFDRQPSFFMLHFDVSGNVIVPCDRCGDDFRLDLWDEFDLLVKLTGEAGEDEEQDEEADVVFIPRHETVIDISGWLYEFVMLSVPLQKVHPDRPDGTPGCNPKALELLHQLAASEEVPKNDIWKGLEAFKPEEEQQEEEQKVNKRKSK